MCPTVCRVTLVNHSRLRLLLLFATTHATAILTSPAPNDVASVCVAVPAPELLLPLLLLFAAAVDAMVAAAKTWLKFGLPPISNAVQSTCSLQALLLHEFNCCTANSQPPPALIIHASRLQPTNQPSPDIDFTACDSFRSKLLPGVQQRERVRRGTNLQGRL